MALLPLCMPRALRAALHGKSSCRAGRQSRRAARPLPQARGKAGCWQQPSESGQAFAREENRPFPGRMENPFRHRIKRLARGMALLPLCMPRALRAALHGKSSCRAGRQSRRAARPLPQARGKAGCWQQPSESGQAFAREENRPFPGRMENPFRHRIKRLARGMALLPLCMPRALRAALHGKSSCRAGRQSRRAARPLPQARGKAGCERQASGRLE